MAKTQDSQSHSIVRPPVIVIMGHIDHGKSTLLDYIRKSNVVAGEAGGITQKISAYEVTHKDASGSMQKITFLDTPGHEAFSKVRSRGANVADIAVLVVSAEDGVKPQTIEALKSIQKSKIPYVVAINKIDKPGANIERTKQNLAENEIFVEGWGGTIAAVPISAKTGQGIPDLLDMLLLTAEVEGYKADLSKPAEGVVIESSLDKKKGIQATLVIKEGKFSSGMVIVAGSALSPARIVEDFNGKKISEAQVCSPINVIGWDEIPHVGETFKAFANKKEAEIYIQENKTSAKKAPIKQDASTEEKFTIPLLIKAQVAGSLDAMEHEIKKIETPEAAYRIIFAGAGDIKESDVKIAGGKEGTIIVGFGTKIESEAQNLAERLKVEIKTFDIIYKLSEWLAEIKEERRPRINFEESIGVLKVLKTFSKMKDKQVIGGRVENGEIHLHGKCKIIRREAEIGQGEIRELQQAKSKTSTVEAGNECGLMVESKVEIAAGDRIECFEMRTK